MYRFPSKIVAKPIESPRAPKPTAGNVDVRRPNVPQATTKLETVLLPSKPVSGPIYRAISASLTMISPRPVPDNKQDLDAIGQDVKEVKASLKKLLEHIFSRKPDCDTPNARAPAGVQPATGGYQPATGGHVTAYLPLVLADFPSGAVPVGPSVPYATVPAVHPSGTVKLALPAYPAYQPPPCPVCRSDRNKK